MSDDQQIEAKIVAQGLTAPRVTLASIDSKIVAAAYWVPDGTTLTICVLTLANGFNVIGSSACVSPENFNVEIGREIAFKNARNEIGQLEGYALAERLHVSAQVQDMKDLGATGAFDNEVRDGHE
jgi:hypothetical protein